MNEEDPMHPSHIAKNDQAIKFLADSLPRLWKGVYDGMITEGFTDSQAIELLKAYILSMGGAK